MASMNCKGMVAIATLATSVVLMGGAAFASPASGTAGSMGNTTGLAPNPVGGAVEAGRNTVADGQNQIKKAFAGSMGNTAVETGRNAAADGLNQIKRAL